MLELSGLYKAFSKKQIIEDFSYSFQQGIYGLLGPNGAGKTTLIRLLIGASLPDHGTVRYQGQCIQKNGKPFREVLGYLPQNHAMYPEFKAIDFLSYMAEMKAVPKQLAKKRIAHLSQQCGLQNDLDKRCKAFSGGMKRRLGLIQALINDPKILILDEPSAGLDPMERIRMRNLLASFSRDRLILISTHIVPDLDRLASHVIFFDQGKIRLEGSPTSLCAQHEQISYELIVPKNFPLHALEEKGAISGIQEEGPNLRIRYVSQEKQQFPLEITAKQVPVSLEDIYLMTFEN